MKNNELWLDSIYSDGSCNFVSIPLPKKGDKICIKVRVLDNAPIDAVVFKTKFNGIEVLKTMEKSYVENGLAYYSIEVQVWEDLLSYQFYFLTKDCVYYYTEKGITTYIQDEDYNFKLLINYEQSEWVKDAVFYQIFPERFCNGNKLNDVKTGEYTFDGYECVKVEDWNKVPENYDKAHCLDFYGGDLEGIQQKIPYLKKLGINAIYLNPIFYGATVHKYDCLDYFNVDPHFGGNKALENLCNELHKNNIKIILDVSINHTGIANKWFNRDATFFDKKEGAYNNPQSEEREYYFFDKNNKYKAWFDVETLPTLNYTSEKLRKRIYKDSDSLVKKWLKAPYNIDGWRFDVADTMARNNQIQLHHEVWPQIRKNIKEENNQAYILAEDWSDCREFLNGNEWDSAMNYYASCRPIRQFYGEEDLFNFKCKEFKNVKYKMTSFDLANRIKNYLLKLPYQIRQVQFNLLDSHDVPRFHNNKNITKDMYQGSCIMLFMLPGSANIYYGDEAEIEGRTDSNEGCRYTMPWDKNIEETFSYKMYSKLIKLKTLEKGFSDSGFKILWQEDYVFSFARFTKDKLWISICSNDEKEEEIKIPLYIFGNNFVNDKVCVKDLFEQEFKYKIEDGYLYFAVPSKKSYLIIIN